MGTNYYAETPSCPNACEHCTATERLHLGKSSIGWRFLFHADPDWPHEEAFARWVGLAASGRIVDEYGEEQTLVDLIRLIEQKRDSASHLEPRPERGVLTLQVFRSSCHEFTARDFS